jgi:hypothetical protein
LKTVVVDLWKQIGGSGIGDWWRWVVGLIEWSGAKMVGTLARGGRGEEEDAESEGRGQDAYTRAGKLSGFYLTQMEEKHRFGLARKTNGRLQGEV